MVAVTGYAILIDQSLVECYLFFLLGYGNTLCGFESYLIHFVTNDTFLRWTANKRGMTGEAICGKFRMRLDELAWTDHQMWDEDRQQNQGGQINGNNEDGRLVFHFHSQNMKILRMWEMPSTANASVIGRCTARHLFIRSKVVASQKSFFSIASPDKPCCE